MIRFALLTVLAITFSGLVSAEERPSITVTGTGNIKVKPDEGYITVGVVTHSKKSAEAVAENTKLMKGLMETLANKGLTEDNIQTVDYSISENYKTVWEKNENGQASQKSIKDGYVVGNSIHLTICDLSKFGEVLDAITASGGNSIHGIQFGSSKSAEKLLEARKKAVADATKKAQATVEAMGLKLGKVSIVTDGGSVRSAPMYSAARFDEAPGGASVPVSSGSVSFTSSVSIKWEIAGQEEDEDDRDRR